MSGDKWINFWACQRGKAGLNRPETKIRLRMARYDSIPPVYYDSGARYDEIDPPPAPPKKPKGSMADYIPNNEGDYGDWLQNLWTKLPTHGPALGMTSEQISALRGLIGDQQALHTETETSRAHATAMEAQERSGKETLNADLRARVRHWKTVAGWSQMVGEDLKLIGVAAELDLENYKPEIAAKIVGGEIRITFKKKGVDGVNVYCRLRGTSAWRKLAFDSSSPYVDTEPLANPTVPETREYKAMGVVKDEEIGQPSDIVSVTLAP